MISAKELGFSEFAGNDKLAWDAFKQGDMRAYEHIYISCSALLFRYGCKLTSDKELIKDCIHDLFTEIWRNKHQLGNPVSIQNYLLKSLKNKLIRQISYNLKFCNEELQSDIDIQSDFFEHEYIVEETRTGNQKRLISALKKLSNREKEVIFLLYYNNLSAAEAAAILSVSIRTIYNTAFNAIRSLTADMVSLTIIVLLLKDII